MTGVLLPSSRASVRSMVPSPPSAIAIWASRGSASSSRRVTPARDATPRTRSTASCTSIRPCVTSAAVSTGCDGCIDPVVEVIGKRRVVGLHEVEEKLPVALRAREPGVYDGGRPGPPVEGADGDLAGDAGADGRGADDPALADGAAARLELRLDEDDRLPAGCGVPEHRRQRDANGDE